MPMDYDDNDYHIHNVHLAGEGSSTVSPVPHPYALPKFDYDDSLQGHLKFDCLVENEVFLGITSQEDNRWIEEYSRGSSGIEFSSSAAESRRNNVWSEATSSESVEMLLKSVRQDEVVLRETITEELAASDEPGNLATIMDSNLKQGDRNDHVSHAQKAMVRNKPQDDYEKSHVTLTIESQGAKSFGGQLDSIVLAKTCNLSKEKVDRICNDASQEAENLAVELVKNELQEDTSTSKAECGDTGSAQNFDTCTTGDLTKEFSSNEAKYSIKNKETSIDEKRSVLSNEESLDEPSFEVRIPLNEESASLTPIESCDFSMHKECRTHESSVERSHGSKCEDSLAIPSAARFVRLQEFEDDNTKSEALTSPESNSSYPSKVSDVPNISVEETEKVSTGSHPSKMGEGFSIKDVGAIFTNAYSSVELQAVSIIKKDPEASRSTRKDETRSSEQCGISMDQDVTFNEGVDAMLPLDCSDMGIKVVGALDSEKNVELTTSVECCTKNSDMALESEADMTILAEPVAAVKCDTISSPDTSDGVHIHVATDHIVAKSSILVVSSVHHDNEKNKEAGFLGDGSSENESPEVANMVDCASEGTLNVVEKATSPECAGNVVHQMAGDCAPPVENINAIMSEKAQEGNPDGLGCFSAPVMNPLPCDSSAKVGDNAEAGGLHLQDPKESMSLLNSEVNMSSKQLASINVELPPECDVGHTRHDEDSSPSVDTLQSVYPSNASNTELSQSVYVTREKAEGAIYEDSSHSEITKDVEGKVQPVSSNSETKRDAKFTFDAGAAAGFEPTGTGQQLFPSIQAFNLSMNIQGTSNNSSGSELDPKKPDEVPVVISQTPRIAIIQVGAKENSERKARRKSVGKESAKKRMKETTPRQSGRGEKSSAPLTPTETGHVIQFEELKPKEKVESSITKSSSILPIPTSNLPDLNNITSIFQQPFTDNQQVQLRAQILVYGSLISGTPPEEPHMIAAFGQSDGARKAWEAAWHACLERLHGQKSQANNPGTPMQSRSDMKDAAHRTPDPGTKHSSTIGAASNKGTPIISPLITVSSPLWNISTPCVGFPSSGMPRSALLDHRQSFSPLRPYQTPPVHNLSGPNPPWLFQGPFAGQWVTSSPVSTFNSGARFSALPITEAVKLTPVKVSASPGIKHAYSIPVVYSGGPSVLSGASSLSDAKKANVSFVQASGDSKSRKRKKVTASVAEHPSVPGQTLIASVTAPPVTHLPPFPRDDGQNHIPLLFGNQTDSVTAPVVSNIFSTSVTVSTPASVTSKTSAGTFLSIPSTHDRLRFGDKPLENVVIPAETLNKFDRGDAGVHTTKTIQLSSDSKSINRKQVTTSLTVNQTSVSRQAPVASVTTPVVAYLPAQNQTDSVTAPVVCSSLPTSVSMSMPFSVTSNSSAGRFHKKLYTASTHGYPKTGYQNMENTVAAEETLSNVKESKLQAENDAVLANNEVNHCQAVLSRLESERSSGVVSDAEAKLMSSTVSIAAAATVAKMAAAAAKIASNVAEQARLMADQAGLSSKTENFNQGNTISHQNAVDKFNKAKPASILKSVEEHNHPNSIISAAREAARRRIEAASAASKHAENLDAIVKAAELAAEAVSQVGKIVAMGDSSALRELVEGGPEGYWKTSQLAYDQLGEVLGHLDSNSGKKNVKAAPNVPSKEMQTLKHGLSPQERSVCLADTQMIVVSGLSSSINEKDERVRNTRRGPKLSKGAGVAPETNTRSLHTYVVGQNMPQSTSGAWEDHNIKEGCLVEVYKEYGKYKGAWLAAKILSLKDEKALVCYTEIHSPDEGSEKLKEWVPLEVEGIEVPRIRISHHMTTMRFEGTQKRRRTAVTDYALSKGDKVDVWMQDCWREGVVMEPNNTDTTSLNVLIPGQGETLVVRSWYVRPTLIWKDGKWIEWSSLKASHASEDETRNGKRMKLGSPAVKDKRKDKSPVDIDLVESRRVEESRTLTLSAQQSSFNVGKNTRDENKLNNTLKTTRSGLQKEGARVIFGVPKPGKKQKFMDVSKHYVAESKKNEMANDSTKFARYLKPKASGWKINSRNDAQVSETKSRVKSRRPSVPSFRTMAGKDNNMISSKSTAGDFEMTDKSDIDVENFSSHKNKSALESSSNTADVRKGPALDAPKKAFTFTSNSKSKHLNKGTVIAADRKTAKVEVKDKSFPEVIVPRRSNRKIQPTSRLLEGLQSSLTISKIPSASQRSHNKGIAAIKGDRIKCL